MLIIIFINSNIPDIFGGTDRRHSRIPLADRIPIPDTNHKPVGDDSHSDRYQRRSARDLPLRGRVCHCGRHCHHWSGHNIRLSGPTINHSQLLAGPDHHWPRISVRLDAI